MNNLQLNDFEKFHKIYSQCFKDYPIRLDFFIGLLQLQEATIFCEYEDSVIAGYAILHSNSISILCVLPEYQKCGYGAKLLRKAETHIQALRYSSVILGRGQYYLLQGVPTVHPNTVDFFEKRGYTAQWTSANMTLPLCNFEPLFLRLPSPPDNITYQFSDVGDKRALLEAVDDAEPNWKAIFETCIDPIMVATVCGEIVGFQILSTNGGRFVSDATLNSVGSIGCVGVIHKAREKGIGRAMVVKGIEWLTENDCSAIELRYVTLVDWYSAMGFQVTGWNGWGRKNGVSPFETKYYYIRRSSRWEINPQSHTGATRLCTRQYGRDYRRV
jgi:GNAT superfamily N-acetyltransferase